MSQKESRPINKTLRIKGHLSTSTICHKYLAWLFPPVFFNSLRSQNCPSGHNCKVYNSMAFGSSTELGDFQHSDFRASCPRRSSALISSHFLMSHMLSYSQHPLPLTYFLSLFDCQLHIYHWKKEIKVCGCLKEGVGFLGGGVVLFLFAFFVLW